MIQNPKKKLLFIITKSNWGGAQKYVHDLASRLPKDNYEIAVALGGDGVLITKLRAARVKVVPIKSLERDVNLGKDLSSFFELIKIIKQEKPDIVHLNSSKIGLLGSIAARLLGVPKIIFTAHGWAFNEDRHPLVKSALKFLSWATTLAAKNIIVLSDKELYQAISFPLAKNKITKIYNGVSVEKRFDKNEARKIISKSIGKNENFLNDKIVIGTISELHKNKGLEYAIRSISSLPARNASHSDPPGSALAQPWRTGAGGRDQAKQSLPRAGSRGYDNFIFIIIGDGDEEEKLKKLIKENNLENHVFLAGFIDNAGKLLEAFDVFTLTSLKEGLPYCLLEAGICGLPIVASRVGGIPEIIDASSGILAEPKNTPSITQALQTLITNQEKRKTLGANAKKRIETIFSSSKMVEKTRQIYEI